MTDATDGQPARGNPYIGPRAFARGETIYGRDRELQRLVHLLIAERIVVLYSPSGAGKSSLIQAGLVPRLEQDAFVVLPVVRVGLEPPAFGADCRSSETTPNRYVQSVILSLEEGQPLDQRVPLNELASLDLPTYLDRRCTSADDDGTTEWVLVFDQFEEILTMDPTDEDAKAAFFAQVGAALRDRRFWALFALREDYLAGLDPYVRPIPTRLHTTFRLDLLGPEAARLAVQQPAFAVGVEFQDAAAERLIDDLRRLRVQQLDGSMLDQLGPYVEPVQLQVVCRRLFERLPPATTHIVEGAIEAVGDVDQALAAYYAEQVAAVASQTGATERAIREWVDRQLITEQGIRGQVLQGQRQTEELPNPTVLALVDTHLVRAERRRGFTWFELAHDRLIGPVRANNVAWFEQHLSELQRHAALWDRHDRRPELLLRGKAYQAAVAWAEAHENECTSVERNFMVAAREVDQAAARDRRRVRWIQRLAVGAALLAVLSTIATIVAAQLKGVADDKTLEAQQQTLVAQRQTQTATLRGLQNEARSLFHSRLDEALLVSLEALKQSDTPETRGILFDALNAEPRLDTLLVGHTGRARGLAFTGDENSALVSADADNRVRTWSVTDPQANVGAQQNATTANVLDGATLVALSPNGAFVATLTGTAGDEVIHLWSVQQSTELGTWKQPQRVDAMAFSPDSALLGAVGPLLNRSTTAQVKLWSVPDGQPQTPIDVHPPTTNPAPPGSSRIAAPTRWPSLAFSDDTKGPPQVALGTNTGEVLVVRRDKPAQVATPLKPPELQIDVTGLAFSPRGRWLVEGTLGADVYLWDLNAKSTDPELLKPLKGHKLSVTSVAFDPAADPSRPLFATASVDGSIILWDAAAKQQFASPPLAGHPSQVEAIAFSSDGQKLASAGLDGPIRVWIVPENDRPLLVNAGPLATRFLNQKNGTGMTALAFDFKGERVAGVYGDKSNSVAVWNAADGSASGPLFTPTLNGQPGTVADLAFSPDGQKLATAGCETQPTTGTPCSRGIVAFWDGATHQPVGQPLMAEGAGLESLAFSPVNRNLLLAGDASGRLHVWNLAEAQPRDAVRQTQGTKPIQALRFTEDGKLLASAASDGLLLWQIPDELQLPDYPLVSTTLGPAVGNPKSLAISAKGALVASVSANATHAIDVWDIANGQPGKPARTLTGHLDTVNGLAFIDEQMLASVSADATLRLWDVTNLSAAVQIGQPLRGYPFGVSSLAYSPETGRLATTTATSLTGVADVQNNLILWQVQPTAWTTLACHIAGHNFSTTTWNRLMGDVPYDGSLCPGEPVIEVEGGG